MTVRSSAGNEQDLEGTTTATAADSAVQGEVDANGEQQTAGSSNAQDATEATLESVIRAAAAPEKPAEVPASSDRKDGQDTAASTEVTPETTDATAAKDESDVPFHKHPRWQEMKRERDTYKAGHEQYEQIQTFISSNRLAPEEVASGFEIMALMRSNPELALQKIAPLVESLERVLGRKLPSDLNQRVEDGVIDQETAAETARLRIANDRATADAEAARVATQQTAMQTHVQGIQAAVATVEQGFQTTDPDYARKQPFVLDRVRALIIEKKPRNSEEATEIVRQAHREVTDNLKPMLVRKQVITPNSGDTAAASRPEPKTLLEAVRNAASLPT